MRGSQDGLGAWIKRYPILERLIDSSTPEDQWDEALEAHIEQAIQWLEASAKNLAVLKEDGISDVLAGKISAFDIVDAVREGNSNGHVDITITVELSLGRRKRLCEAKIYGGPAYHIEGLEQLVKRYSTGRDRSAYMFDYFKVPAIDDKVKDIRATMDKGFPLEQQGDTRDYPVPSMKWAFESDHRHRSSKTDVLRVVHFGVNLCWSDGEEKGKA